MISLASYEGATVRAVDYDLFKEYAVSYPKNANGEPRAQLIKALPGLPAGTILLLRDLHERLFDAKFPT